MILPFPHMRLTITVLPITVGACIAVQSRESFCTLISTKILIAPSIIRNSCLGNARMACLPSLLLRFMTGCLRVLFGFCRLITRTMSIVLKCIVWESLLRMVNSAFCFSKQANLRGIAVIMQNGAVLLLTISAILRCTMYIRLKRLPHVCLGILMRMLTLIWTGFSVRMLIFAMPHCRLKPNV